MAYEYELVNGKVIIKKQVGTASHKSISKMIDIVDGFIYLFDKWRPVGDTCYLNYKHVVR